MSYTLLDEAVDSVADKIDEGITADQAIEEAAAACMVPVDDLLESFADAYLCTPSGYEQNREADLVTANSDLVELEAADLDEISLVTVSNDDII